SLEGQAPVRTTRPGRLVCWLDMLFFAFAAIVLGWHLSSLLSPRLRAGWDVVPHFYLLEFMLNLLRDGRAHGYDLNWFAGYSAFTLYPPLFYILSAIPTLLSGGAISLSLAYNLMQLLLPCLLLGSLYLAGRSFFGREAGSATL